MATDITSIAFGEVRFGEAVKALRDLAPMSDDQFYALEAAARQRAFSFAGSYSDSVSQAVLDMLAESAGGELSEQQFTDKINAVLARYDMTIEADQANLIWEMTLSKVFNAGALARVTSSPVISAAYPYWGIDTAMDSRVRHNHFALDWRRIKTVFPLTDELIDLWPLPAGFNCRCARRFFSGADVEKFGLAIGRGEDWYGKVQSVTVPGARVPTKTVAILPDPGFGAGLTAKSPSPGYGGPRATLDLVAIAFALKACALRRAA